MISLTLGFTLLTQLFLLKLEQLHPTQLLYPIPFTPLQAQLLLVQLQLLLWRLQIHLFVMCLLLVFPQVLVWIHPILLLCCLVLHAEVLTFNLPQPGWEKFARVVFLWTLYLLLLYQHPMALSCLLTIDWHREQEELSDRIRSGHSSKSNLCRGCLQAEGPRKIHRTIRDIDRATHALHVDIAGPHYHFRRWLYLLPSWCFTSTRLLRSLWCLEQMVAFFRIAPKWRFFAIPDSSRQMSSCVGELTAPYFERLSHQSQEHLPHLYLWLWPSVQWNCWTCSWPSQISCG